MTTPTLREQLVRLRQGSGVSQAELAQWIGVTQTAVSYWESGRRQPGLDDVERWAAALGASPNLLQGSPTAGRKRETPPGGTTCPSALSAGQPPGASSLRDQMAMAMLADLRASRPDAAPDPDEERAAYDLTDAVLPVVRAGAAEQTQRADDLEAALAARVEDHAMAAKFVGEWLGISSPLPAVTSIGCVQALAAYADDDIAELRKRAEQAEALLRELVDTRPCTLRPNGFCETHSERAPCPHAEAVALVVLAALDRPDDVDRRAPVADVLGADPDWLDGQNVDEYLRGLRDLPEETP